MALYHIHRPQTFAHILGQDHVKQTLRQQVLSGNVAHAYLFTGPRGVGKTSTARIVAKAVNAGVDKDGEILENDIATSITNGSAIDVIEIDAASHTGVDNVREQIIENAQFRPTTLPKKVFIIDEVHMLSTSAFNALLKVLEEPPEYVIFILATTEPHKVPATILSRCQRFDFRPIPYDTLSAHLEQIATDAGVTIDPAVLSRIVHKSDGGGRDAVSLLDQIMSIGKQTITTEDVQMILPVSDTESIEVFCRALITRQQEEALARIEEVMTHAVDMRHFGKDILSYLRYMMIAKTGADIARIAPDLSTTAIATILTLVKDLPYAEILHLIDETVRRVQEISRAPIPQLPLEMLVISWCSTDDAPSAPPSTPKETLAPRASDRTVQAEKNNPLPKTPPTSERTTAQPAPATSSTVTEMSAASWDQIIAHVETTSPSLVFILKMATITSVEHTMLSITVAYQFHKDKLESAEVKQTIESAIETVMGSRYTLQVLVADTPMQPATTAPPVQDPGINDLAAAFGGTIVS